MEAVELLGSAAVRPQASAEVWAHFGMALVGLGRSSEARNCFERSLALTPDQPGLWNNLGMILLYAGDDRQALDAFQQALVLQPNLLAARRNACLALYALGREAEAEALLPLSPDRHVLRGQALRENGDLEGATESYRQAILLLEQEVVPGPATSRPRFTQEAARTALLAAKNRLDAAAIPFCLLAGTLLGVVREGDILAHDKDLDLAMAWDADRGLVVKALCAGGLFTVPWFWGILPPERPWYRSFTHAETGCTLDVFFLRPEGNEFLCGFDHRPVPVLSRLKAFGLRDWSWMNRWWKVPDPPEQYLQEVYGPNWRVPDASYDTILSNPARTAASLPLVLCMGYLRVFEAMKEGRLAPADSLAAQILARTDDTFLVDLRIRIGRRIHRVELGAGGDG